MFPGGGTQGELTPALEKLKQTDCGLRSPSSLVSGVRSQGGGEGAGAREWLPYWRGLSGQVMGECPELATWDSEQDWAPLGPYPKALLEGEALQGTEAADRLLDSQGIQGALWVSNRDPSVLSHGNCCKEQGPAEKKFFSLCLGPKGTLGAVSYLTVSGKSLLEFSSGGWGILWPLSTGTAVQQI